MIQGFHTAANTMVNQQKKINVISGNIANVGTASYKRTDIQFEEVFYANYQDHRGEFVEEDYQVGNGTFATNVTKNFGMGALKQTNNPLDIAIEGDGFLTLRDNNGNTYYTRGGNFQLSQEATGTYIVNSDGYYLVNTQMQPINVVDGNANFGPNGSISINDVIVGTLNTVSFSYPDQLDIMDNGLYVNGTGQEIGTNNNMGAIVQGYIEQSNVDLSTEMVDLIETQRTYQMNSKLVQTIDEMQSIANRMRR